MLAPCLPTSIQEWSYPLPGVEILESFLQEKFERIIRIAKNLFDVPNVSISFVNEHHRIFKTFSENQLTDISHDIYFFEHVFSKEEVFYVSETLRDERFRSTPCVMAQPSLRFYAGFPLFFNHHKIGIVSISDHKPRYLSFQQLTWLKDLAALVETEIYNYVITTDKGKLKVDLDKARLASMIDPLTNLWNRQGIYNILRQRMDDYLLSELSFGVAILDIDNFKKINDTFGHESGDQALKLIAQSLIAGCRETDAIGRWGGEEFLLLINEPKILHIIEVAERIRSIIATQAIRTSSLHPLEITVTIGATSITPKTSPTLEELINKADRALYQGKRNGRNQVVVI